MSTTTLHIEIEADEAEALAQLVKRITWTAVRTHAATDDEADRMMRALDLVRSELARQGFAPR